MTVPWDKMGPEFEDKGKVCLRREFCMCVCVYIYFSYLHTYIHTYVYTYRDDDVFYLFFQKQQFTYIHT
jgi:hypothetical protein